MDNTQKVFEDIIKDCFWGDYSYTADDIMRNLNSGDEKFRLFIFSKIFSNSNYPSKYLRILFTKTEIESFFSKVSWQKTGYYDLRKKLVMANLLDSDIEIRELSWKKK